MADKTNTANKPTRFQINIAAGSPDGRKIVITKSSVNVLNQAFKPVVAVEAHPPKTRKSEAVYLATGQSLLELASRIEDVQGSLVLISPEADLRSTIKRFMDEEAKRDKQPGEPDQDLRSEAELKAELARIERRQNQLRGGTTRAKFLPKLKRELSALRSKRTKFVNAQRDKGNQDPDFDVYRISQYYGFAKVHFKKGKNNKARTCLAKAEKIEKNSKAPALNEFLSIDAEIRTLEQNEKEWGELEEAKQSARLALQKNPTAKELEQIAKSTLVRGFLAVSEKGLRVEFSQASLSLDLTSEEVKELGPEIKISAKDREPSQDPKAVERRERQRTPEKQATRRLKNQERADAELRRLAARESKIAERKALVKAGKEGHLPIIDPTDDAKTGENQTSSQKHKKPSQVVHIYIVAAPYSETKTADKGRRRLYTERYNQSLAKSLISDPSEEYNPRALLERPAYSDEFMQRVDALIDEGLPIEMAQAQAKEELGGDIRQQTEAQRIRDDIVKELQEQDIVGYAWGLKYNNNASFRKRGQGYCDHPDPNHAFVQCLLECLETEKIRDHSRVMIHARQPNFLKIIDDIERNPLIREEFEKGLDRDEQRQFDALLHRLAAIQKHSELKIVLEGETNNNDHKKLKGLVSHAEKKAIQAKRRAQEEVKREDLDESSYPAEITGQNPENEPVFH